MKRTRSARLGTSLAAALVGSAALAACGAGSGALTASSSLAGVAFSNAAVTGGTVTVTDSSATPRQRQATTAADGSFSVDVSGLTAPYAVQVAFREDGAARTLQAVSDGTAGDVNPLTDLAVAYAMGACDPQHVHSASPAEKRAAAAEASAVLTDLTVQLAPVLNACGVRSLDPHGGDARNVLRGMRVRRSCDTLTLANRETGGTVQTVALDTLEGGTLDPSQFPTTGPCGGFDPGQIPTGALPGGLDPAHVPSAFGASDGATLYAVRCARCHGPLGSSQHQGATAAQILARHENLVSSTDAAAIATALASGGSASGSTSSSGATSSSGTTSSSGASSGGGFSPVSPGHLPMPTGVACTSCHSGRRGGPPPGSSGGAGSSSGGSGTSSSSGSTSSSSGGTSSSSSSGGASSSSSSSSGATSSSGSSSTTTLPSWHPTIPSGASCSSCH